jgi:hypothetical protein
MADDLSVDMPPDPNGSARSDKKEYVARAGAEGQATAWSRRSAQSSVRIAERRLRRLSQSGLSVMWIWRVETTCQRHSFAKGNDFREMSKARGLTS